MSAGQRFPLAVVLRYAERLVEALRPHCERVEVAGSVRRCKPAVGDLEVVLVPRLRQLQPDLFGAGGGDAVNEAWEEMDRLTLPGSRLQQVPGRRGERFRQFRHEDGLYVDVFAVLRPAEWGPIFAIRTGSAEFSQRAVTMLRRKGLRCSGGAVYKAGPDEGTLGERVPCPEERDFLDLCGIGWVEPKERVR